MSERVPPADTALLPTFTCVTSLSAAATTASGPIELPPTGASLLRRYLLPVSVPVLFDVFMYSLRSSFPIVRHRRHPEANGQCSCPPFNTRRLQNAIDRPPSGHVAGACNTRTQAEPNAVGFHSPPPSRKTPVTRKSYPAGSRPLLAARFLPKFGNPTTP
jgi:hypothetical protein